MMGPKTPNRNVTMPTLADDRRRLVFDALALAVREPCIADMISQLRVCLPFHGELDDSVFNLVSCDSRFPTIPREVRWLGSIQLL